MKYLYLVRHAKSSWDDASLSDSERPLSKRGKKDAPFMGKLLRKMKISPDIIITSPAKRALITARIIAEELGYPEKKIVINESIYGAVPREILSIIAASDNNINSIMIFGHNPALTTLVNHVSDAGIENLPTCSVAAIGFTADSWEELAAMKGKLLFFEYPKKYPDKK